MLGLLEQNMLWFQLNDEWNDDEKTDNFDLNLVIEF